MRGELEGARTGSDVFLVGAVYDLALVAAVLLSMGSAPTTHATASIGAPMPGAAEIVSTTADGSSPGVVTATEGNLDLQLD